MPNYQNGKIYKLICDKTDKIYIGSTVQSLKQRLGLHKSKKTCTSKQLLELGEVKIELIENYSCNTKKELETKERYYIEKYKDIVVNKCIPTRTDKEYYDEVDSQRKKEKYDNNKEYYKQKSKKNYEANKDIISEKDKKYYKENKDIISEKMKQYYQKNKDEIIKKKKIKMTCQCNSVIRKSEFFRHCKSIKHQNYLKSLKINI